MVELDDCAKLQRVLISLPTVSDKMKHVVINAPFPDYLRDKIKAVSPDIAISYYKLPNRQWPPDKHTDAEVIYATGGVPSPTQAPNLRWIQVHWAGVDKLVNTPVWDSDILITSASGIHAPNLAQYAMTQILSWAHRVPQWFKYQNRGEWPTDRWNKFVPDEVNGRTLGILGYGSIGRELARLAKGFGMTVYATKRDVRHIADTGFIIPGTGDPTGDLPDRIYPAEATRSMLPECDYVVVILPLTEKTHHFIDADLLREMKSTAFLVNIGRGSLIKEPDLIKGLRKGWIAGAGLDVFETEPLPANSPFWQMENVILTPHVGGFTKQYDNRAVDLFTENLRRYLAGEPLLNLVNREKQY